MVKGVSFVHMWCLWIFSLEKSLLKCGEDLLGPSSSSPPPPPVPLGGKRKEEELEGADASNSPPLPWTDPPLPRSYRRKGLEAKKREGGRGEMWSVNKNPEVEREGGRERKEGERRKFVFQKEICWGTERGAGGKIFNLAPFGMEEERDF